MDFFQDLTQVQDEVAAIAEQFGVPQVTSLIVCRRSRDTGTTYLEIQPKPFITRVSPRLVALYGASKVAQLEIEDLQVKGVSRSYSLDQIWGGGVSYIVGGELMGGEAIGGYQADAVPGMGAPVDKGSTWTLLLRRRKS